MKRTLTKGVLLVFLVTLVFSFAACGKDEEDTTTGVPTTIEQTTAQSTTAPVSTPLSTDVIKVALNSAGDNSWDGNYVTLTAEQKRTIMDYFAGSGKTVMFKEDNVYLMIASGEETTAPSDETTAAAVEGSTKKPATSGVKTGTAAVKSVLLSERALTMYIGDSKQLTATVSPSDAKDKKVNWTSGNDKIASVNANGVVLAKTEGTTTITCVSNENPAVTASCAIAVTKAPTGAVLSYKYNEGEEFFYIEDDPWQRQFGFNRLYDQAAPVTVMFYDTVRIKFNHGGEDWMIQLWKGQYGLVFIGSEIGVYIKDPKQTVEHYNCADNDHLLKMEMSLYNGDNWLFTRTYEPYWWITGFVPGSLTRFKDPSSLTMLARVTLRDNAMKDLFVKGLEENGFTSGYGGFSTVNTYKVDGTSVYFNWRGGESPLTKVRFDAAGGVGGTDWTQMKYGTELVAPEVTKEGYTFVGWTKPLSNRIITFPQTVPSSDTTYIAKWAENNE